MRLFFIFVLGLLTASCGNPSALESSAKDPDPVGSGKIVPSKETPRGEFPPVAIAPAEGWLRATVEALAEPNRYEVKLSWTRPDGPVEAWMIQKSQGKEPSRPLARLAAGTTQLSDSSVRSGQTYRYSLNGAEETTWREWAEIEITIPTDREIRGPHTIASLGDLRGIRRLFLRGDAQLTFESTNSNLEVEEIIAEDALVSSFPLNQTAAEGLNGRSAGELRIRAKRGGGRLRLVNNAENGGVGMRGMIGASGLPGRNGAEAKLKKMLDEVQDLNAPAYGAHITNQWNSWFYVYTNTKPIGPHAPEWRRLYVCVEPATSGTNGLPGQSGGKGASGGRGGNAGKILVDIEDAAKLDIVSSVSAGRGGAPGEGGPGGPGGAGGLAGAPDEHRICPIGVPGNPGPAGPSGPRGEAGPDGAKGSVCVRSKNAQQGDCGEFEAISSLSK